MQQQIFTYKGKELATKLEILTQKLQFAIKKLEDKSAVQPVMVDGRKLRFPTIEKYEQISKNYSHNENLNYCIASMDRAQNWLMECKREPRRKYQLDLEDLSWIYQRWIDSL